MCTRYQVSEYHRFYRQLGFIPTSAVFLHSSHLVLNRHFIFAKDLLGLLFPLKQTVVFSKDDHTRTTTENFSSKSSLFPCESPRIYTDIFTSYWQIYKISYYFTEAFLKCKLNKNFHFLVRKET